MKNTYITIAIIIIIAVLAFVFGSKKTSTPETSMQATSTALTDGEYKVDAVASSIKWSIEYPSGATEEGTMDLKSGSLVLANGMPFSGNFDIDMATLKPDSNLVLENYLKAKNVLDVDNYPTSSFVVSKVLPNPVSGTTTGKFIFDGRFTVKDKTASVSFPVTFSQQGNRLTGVSSFALNKSEWGIDNKEIKNAVSLELHIELLK